MAAFLEEIAPLNHAGKITKPLFVAQGLNDPRVPYTEAEQMVKAVRGNGGDVWFLMFKDEGHGFAKSKTAISMVQPRCCFGKNICWRNSKFIAG